MANQSLSELQEALSKKMLMLGLLTAITSMLTFLPLEKYLLGFLNVDPCQFGYYQGVCNGNWLSVLLLVPYLVDVLYLYNTVKLYNKIRSLKTS